MNFVSISPQQTPFFRDQINFEVDDTRLINHNLSRIDIMVMCYTQDNRKIEPANIQVVDANNILLTFHTASNVRCIIM